MVARFGHAAEDINLVDGAGRAGRPPLEILTIAGIVQAEAGRHEDMPKIARVIYNRLNRKMPLQLDCTVLYGLDKYGVSAALERTSRAGRRTTPTSVLACRPPLWATRGATPFGPR
jgi:UPF0755 protein